MADELTFEMRKGSQVTIAAYVMPDKTVPVRDLIRDWATSPHKPEKTAARHYTTSFTKRADGQKLLGEEFHGFNDGTELVEFKHRGTKTRLLGFMDGKVLVVHYIVFGKKEDEIDPGEVDRAVKRRKEYFDRKAGPPGTAGPHLKSAGKQGGRR